MDLERPSKRAVGSHAGVVFTPPELALHLAKGLESGANPPRQPILDPACGEGALLLAALEARGGGPGEAKKLFGIEIDPVSRDRALTAMARAAGLAPGHLEGNFICADALDPATRWPRGTAILGNPPWLSFSGRHASPEPPRGSEHRGPGGWPSLQAAFLQRIAVHCHEQDRPARLLLPGSMLELEGYAPLRQAISEHVHLACAPEELGEEAFPGVLEPAVLVSLAPGAGEPIAPQPQARSSFLTRLANFPKLPPETFADSGVHTGNSSKLLVHQTPTENSAPMRRGADLEAFRLGPARLHLRLDLPRNTEQRFRIAPREHYESFSVLLRQTADRPIAALHARPTYFRNSLLGARHPDGLAPEFLVGLLNSSIATRWHREMFRDARQRSFPQVKVKHLRSQPTPIRKREEDARLHDDVVERVRRGAPSLAGKSELRLELDQMFLRAFGLEPS